MARSRKAAPPEAGGLSHDVKVRIDSDLAQRISEAARREDRSESAIVRRAIRLYLDGHEPPRQ